MTSFKIKVNFSTKLCFLYTQICEGLKCAVNQSDPVYNLLYKGPLTSSATQLLKFPLLFDCTSDSNLSYQNMLYSYLPYQDFQHFFGVWINFNHIKLNCRNLKRTRKRNIQIWYTHHLNQRKRFLILWLLNSTSPLEHSYPFVHVLLPAA